jgi:hypothetical protein
VTSTWPIQVGIATAAVLTVLIGVVPPGIDLARAAALALP